MSEVPAVTADRPRRWHALPPTRYRKTWICVGLVVQLVAISGPLAWVAVRTERVQGVLSKSTLLLVGREIMHTHRGVLVLSGAAIVFALGSVALARPYARSMITLAVAVPIAAIVGLLVLGAAALIVALIVFLFSANVDVPSGGGSGSSKKGTGEKPARTGPARD